MAGVVLHTSSPVLAAILSLGENKRKTGKDIILATAGLKQGSGWAKQLKPSRWRQRWLSALLPE